jgi:hypothetical protein
MAAIHVAPLRQGRPIGPSCSSCPASRGRASAWPSWPSWRPASRPSRPSLAARCAAFTSFLVAFGRTFPAGAFFLGAMAGKVGLLPRPSTERVQIRSSPSRSLGAPPGRDRRLPTWRTRLQMASYRAHGQIELGCDHLVDLAQVLSDTWRSPLACSEINSPIAQLFAASGLLCWLSPVVASHWIGGRVGPSDPEPTRAQGAVAPRIPKERKPQTSTHGFHVTQGVDELER